MYLDSVVETKTKQNKIVGTNEIWKIFIHYVHNELSERRNE